MNLNILIVSIALICNLSSCRVESQAVMSSAHSLVFGELGQRLDSIFTLYLDQYVADYDLSGLSLGVVRGRELINAKALGYQNAEKGIPMELNSVFHMASISKSREAELIVTGHFLR